MALFIGWLAIGCATLDRSTDERAIRHVLDAQQRAWNDGDIREFMVGYDQRDDIVFTSGGHVRRGYDATLSRYEATYGNAQEMGHLDFEVLEVRFLGPDHALVMGRFNLQRTPKAGTGLFTLVFTRRSEGWRCIHDHTSADTGK